MLLLPIEERLFIEEMDFFNSVPGFSGCWSRWLRLAESGYFTAARSIERCLLLLMSPSISFWLTSGSLILGNLNLIFSLINLNISFSSPERWCPPRLMSFLRLFSRCLAALLTK